MKKLKNWKVIPKKTFDDLSMIENHKSELTKEKENSKVIDGVVLLNTCMACHNKFKPVNSMIYETSCNVCSEKKQIS
jgi:hypothetical protein